MANAKVNFDNLSGKIKPMHAVNNVPCMPRDSAKKRDGKIHLQNRLFH